MYEKKILFGQSYWNNNLIKAASLVQICQKKLQKFDDEIFICNTSNSLNPYSCDHQYNQLARGW